MSAALLAETPEILSKADFARRIGVSPGRVSQYIAEGKLDAEAFEGEGLRAKVKVAVAEAQLRRRLDVNQRFGRNGIDTRLDSAPAAVQAPAPAPARRVDETEERIKREKLREIEYRNRAAAEKELASRGVYTLTADVQPAMAQLAGRMMNVFEGSLTDLANALAARFELPQRDVLHQLRGEFREIRAKAARAAEQAAATMPGLVVHDTTPEGAPAGDDAETPADD